MLFLELAKTFDQLEKTSGRIEMSNILANLFKKATPDEIDKIVYLIQGILKPPYYGVDLGLGEKFAIEAVCNASGYSKKQIEDCYKEKGDLGDCAQWAIHNKKQQSLFSKSLSLDHVYATMFKIATFSGSGSTNLKIKHLAELLNNATALEAKYLVRYVLNKLRLGVGDPTILDSLSLAKQDDKGLRESLERAYNICSDLGLVARKLFENVEAIYFFKVTPFKPLMPALAERLSSPHEIIEKLGSCMVEMKYDGFRMQCHKQEAEVKIFSRKLEDMTEMFPDLILSIKQLPFNEMIFEGEALAYNIKEQRFYSFQETMHRRRKHGIDKASEDFPLTLFIFDIMYLDGQDLTVLPYKERRKKIEQIFNSQPLICSEGRLVSSADEIEQMFNLSLDRGLEGIMAKDLNAPYTAGKRKFAWIKLKKSYGKEMDTVDAVVVGYYLGQGARAQFEFGGVLVAVYNEETDQLETIAKVASGFTEEEMRIFKQKLTPLTIPEKPKNLKTNIEVDYWVEPKIVIEVAYDEISLSPQHTAGKGYALRFPRFIRFREDKSVADITTVKEVEELYSK